MTCPSNEPRNMCARQLVTSIKDRFVVKCTDSVQCSLHAMLQVLGKVFVLCTIWVQKYWGVEDVETFSGISMTNNSDNLSVVLLFEALKRPIYCVISGTTILPIYP